VKENKRDPDEILARVRATPRAALTRSRQVLALWFDASHPAAPVNPDLIDKLPEAPAGLAVPPPADDSTDKPAAKAAEAKP
jgi:hypothetical protein